MDPHHQRKTTTASSCYASAARSVSYRHLHASRHTASSRSGLNHLIKPARTVQAEPMVLLSAEAMEILYNEQLHRHPVRYDTTATAKLTRSAKQRQLLQPHDEPRTSDGSSRPRTSTSSSLSSSHPHAGATADNDEDDDLSLVFEHSIVLENARVDSAHGERECQVCYEKMEPCDAQTCSTCHTSFCRNCIKWYMEYKVVEGEVSEKKLVCPASQCSEPLREEFIKRFVSTATFAKYLKYRENQKPGVRFCPRAGCCTKIDEPAFSTSRRVTCSSCHAESCMRCGGDSHALPTCRRKERRYGKWKKRSNVQRCPNCKSDIEKQGGCAHMKCFQCDEEFCWSCMRPWQTHNETLCVALKFLKSKNPKYGRWAPVRAVTKTAVVGAVAVAAVAAAGVAAVVLPPVFLLHWARHGRSRHRESLHSDAFIIE